jgi:hypothetical protein
MEAFQLSFNQGFKPAVCLYYLGYLSAEDGKPADAANYYLQISQLPLEEKKEVEQAAQMQLGDLWLKDVETRVDTVKNIEQKIIPQYLRAIKIDPDSRLAGEMKNKIRELQQKYELVLFKMRNNRPTQVPPYFLRASLDNAFDDNVVYSADETNLAQSDKASAYSKADFMGRYSFYYKNIMSFAPEFKSNRTHYWNRKDNIQANDNYAMIPAIRTAYEHSLWQRPASHLFDYEFNYAHRNLNSDDKLIFSSRTHTYMLGERFNFLTNGETIVRLKRRQFESFNENSNSSTSSFVLEQVLSLQSGFMLILMGSYDQTRNETKTFNTNALMTRGDVIFPRYKDWFTMTLGLSTTFTDPYNNEERGKERTLNPSLKFTRTISGRLRGTWRFEYTKNSSDADAFQYTKRATGLEMEYVF